MKQKAENAGRLIEKTTNVLFVVIASFVVIVIAGLIFKLTLTALIDPIYEYLKPRMGYFFIIIVFVLLVLVGVLGELLGSLLAQIPLLIFKIKQGKIFVTFFRHFKNFSELIGIYGVAKLTLLMVEKQDESVRLLVRQETWDGMIY
jgi:hypothetical protein